MVERRVRRNGSTDRGRSSNASGLRDPTKNRKGQTPDEFDAAVAKAADSASDIIYSQRPRYTFPVSAKTQIDVSETLEGHWAIRFRDTKGEVVLIIDDNLLLMTKIETAFVKVLRSNGSIRDYVKQEVERELRRAQSHSGSQQGKGSQAGGVKVAGSHGGPSVEEAVKAVRRRR